MGRLKAWVGSVIRTQTGWLRHYPNSHTHESTSMQSTHTQRLKTVHPTSSLVTMKTHRNPPVHTHTHTHTVLDLYGVVLELNTKSVHAGVVQDRNVRERQKERAAEREEREERRGRALEQGSWSLSPAGYTHRHTHTHTHTHTQESAFCRLSA